MKKVFLFLIIVFSSVQFVAQAQPASASATDPAQNFNIITRDKFSNSYTLVGGYKVRGNPYLYGGSNDGVIYLKEEGTKKGKLSYNTFSQQVEFIEIESNKTDIKDVNTIDSFTLIIHSEVYDGELRFVNGSTWDTKNKFFVQKVFSVTPYDLYKRFYSSLEVITTNYVQSELRQFELNSDYYYFESQHPKLIKLKANESGLKKEFASKKDCFNSLDFSPISSNKEDFLKSFFQLLINCR